MRVMLPKVQERATPKVVGTIELEEFSSSFRCNGQVRRTMALACTKGVNAWLVMEQTTGDVDL